MKPALMKKTILIAIFLCFLLSPSRSQNVLEAPLAPKERTQILILASPHLSAYNDQFDPRSVEKLLELLKAWQPDLICIEALSPLSTYTANSNSKLYSSVISQFGSEIIEVGGYFQNDLKCDWGQAVSRYDSLGRRLQVDPDNKANRAAFTKYAFASYRYYTGLLQYKSLDTETIQAMAIPKNIMAILQSKINSSNENIQVGLRLAERLGQEELHQIDDHLDKDIFMKIAPALVNDLNSNEEYSKVLNSGLYKDSEDKLKEGLASKNLLEYYKLINSDAYMKADLDEQWKLFFRTKLDSKLDRIRVGLWEVRNLNIASNIRRVSALYPGRKILVIIGTSHKIFLDQYLDSMMEVDMVNLNQL